ncbi:MAG: hypothetical protein KDA91_19735 [Planctomycetaceae bacterium]|nr:hypothetical protein [Planctomycetaceae bacterium]
MSFNSESRGSGFRLTALLFAWQRMNDVIEHNGRIYVPERRLLLATKAAEQRWSQVHQLRSAMQDIRAFAAAHHADQAGHVWLHGLTVDIPAMVDDAMSK